MIRFCSLLALMCCLLAAASAQAAPTPKGTIVQNAGLSGQVVGFRMSGVEPDGDPIDQAVLKTRLAATSTTPAVNLVVNAYLENFKPDTTPILPDLLHPKKTAQNLGGFLQGKVLLTDDAGNVLYIGSFLAEAFLDNTNHAVMRLDGGAAAAGSHVALKGSFSIRRNATIAGSLTGTLQIPPAARRQLQQQAGKKMRPITDIIKVVTVRPAPMMGKATTGTTGAPLKTGFSKTQGNSVGQQYSGNGNSTAATSTTRSISPWTIAAGAGAVISFVLAGILYWSQRRTAVG